MRLLLVLFFFPGSIYSSATNKLPAEKILQVIVDEIGTVSIGRDTVGADNLARYIQERLFKSYMGTGKMHSKIKFLKASTNVPDMVAEVVIKEIQDGQRRALKELCLQKYRNLFESINKKKQAKLKKQFPVLFQTEYQ
ncbi:MAG: hypothetical protein SGI83_03735 [Bacteroidota bacterium]|nr:hypothetical protein [Bacteroidota bacterium]